MSSEFPFEEVAPSELVKGHKYYIGAKTKTKGIVTKMSGIFEGQIVNDLGEKYAEFSNLQILGKPRKKDNDGEGKGWTLRSYNSGKILNPSFVPGNIMVGKKLPNGTYKRYKRETVKLPGHQKLNIKNFSSRIWLLNLKKWKFGAGLRNAAGAHMAEEAMKEELASRGVELPPNIVTMRSFFAKTNKNTTFKNRNKNNGGNNNGNNNNINSNKNGDRKDNNNT
jgi:hypothetical protein